MSMYMYIIPWKYYPDKEVLNMIKPFTEYSMYPEGCPYRAQTIKSGNGSFCTENPI